MMRTLTLRVQVEVDDNLGDVLLKALFSDPAQPPPVPAREGPPTRHCLSCGLLFDAGYQRNPAGACPACGSDDLIALPEKEGLGPGRKGACAGAG